MHKGKVAVLAAVLAVAANTGRSQVLSPPEILDPAMRALQQKHLPELKAAAVDITSQHYPFRFSLSRTLDLTERQQAATDQRSIRFAKFQGSTVLQVTGNYFAAYSEQYAARNVRIRRTYLDVVLPILRATAPRLSNESQLSAFAIEVSQHVRKQVLGVPVERPENLALVFPRSLAERVAASTNENEQVTALLEARAFLNGAPVTLWPDAEAEDRAREAPASLADPQPASALGETAVAASAPVAPTVSPAAPAAPTRDVSGPALQRQQAALQPLTDRILHDLDATAHFIPYAPPALIEFRKAAYLQLSVTTNFAAPNWGSQYRAAALAFDQHVSHLIRPLVAMLPPEDPGFDGVVFSATVRGPDQTSDAPFAQSVEFFWPLSEMRRYAQYDVTGQQLINSGFVLVNGERVGLELQSAEAEGRR